jgi:hypothetical protein
MGKGVFLLCLLVFLRSEQAKTRAVSNQLFLFCIHRISTHGNGK